MARTRPRQLRTPTPRVPSILGLVWLAIAAMVAQAVLPLLHSPDGGPVWQPRGTLALDQAPEPCAGRPVGERQPAMYAHADHDCSTCPVCQSIQAGGRPGLPPTARTSLTPAVSARVAVRTGESFPIFRLDAANGPRGPPCSC